MSRSRPKIPFMMFQDVIMAVFGILILIVLYLLINAKVSDIEFVEALEEMRDQKAILSGSIEAAEAQQTELFESAVEFIEGRKSLELRKQVEANAEQIVAFDDVIRELSAEVENQSELLNTTIEEKFESHPGVIRARDGVFKLQAELAVIADAITDVGLESEKTERDAKTTKSYLEDIENQFRVLLDDSLAGEIVYLVDFGQHKLRAFRVFNGQQTEVSCANTKALLEKVKSDNGKKRVYLFVRPNAIEEFENARSAFKRANIPVGYQPVPLGEELILAKFPDGVPSVGVATSPSGGSASSGPASSGTVGGDAAVGAGGAESAPAGGENGVTQNEGEAGTAQTTPESGDETETSEGAEEDGGGDDTVEPEVDSPSGGGDQDSTEGDSQTFNWLLLIFIVLFLIVLFLTVRGSKR